MKNYAVILMTIFVSIQNVSHASGRREPEQSAIDDMIHGIQLFEALHGGHSPTNWLQISEVLNLGIINELLQINGLSPLDQNYVFVQQKIPVLAYEKGDVVLIRAGPITIPMGETNTEE